MFSQRSNVRKFDRGEAKGLARIDADRREREVRFYHERPEQLMPVMVPVSQMKGRVQWPAKFQ